MPVTRSYECPDCSHVFKWLHIDADDAAPAHCPFCGNYMGEETQEIPGGFAILTAKGKTVDHTYRQLEASSEARAEMAGDPSLKVTNLRDNLREGDVAAMPVNNDITRFAAAQNHQFFQAQVGDALASSKMGSERRTGSFALEQIQQSTGGGPSIPSGLVRSGAGFGGGAR